MKISRRKIGESIIKRLTTLSESDHFRFIHKDGDDTPYYTDKPKLLDGSPALMYYSIEDNPMLAVEYLIFLTEDRIEVYLDRDFRGYTKEGYTDVESLKKDGQDILDYFSSIKSENSKDMRKRSIISYLKKNGFIYR